MESAPQDYLARDGSRAASSSTCRQDEASSQVIGNPSDAHTAQLARAIEFEIIPRLLLAHQVIPDLVLRFRGPRHPVTEDEVRHFTQLVLASDEDAAFSTIHALRARKVPIESIYLDLLAPTARRLGVLWEEDLCDFTDVTVALGRLQRVLRELSPSLAGAVSAPAQRRRVLLLPSPGEQHTFGLVMVAEFFRLAGWDVAGGSWLVNADAATMVNTEWFDAIGFSLGAEVHLPALGACIDEVRRATCNPRLAVLVGGPIFSEHPEYAARVGADAMTTDAREAPILAERLVRGCAGGVADVD